jgi:molybdopterin-biosynthesis enzyme MoeA-like protein
MAKTAAMLVIGDEILSGRTQDINSNYVAKQLTAIGIDLKEVRVVGVERAPVALRFRLHHRRHRPHP